REESSVVRAFCNPNQNLRGAAKMATDKIVVELRRHESGKLKAFADVVLPSTLGEITVRGFRVVQDDGAAPWVAFPTTSYMKAGERVNKQIVEVGRSLKAQIADAVLAEFRAAQNGGSHLPERS